jgi:protoporphyrinogen oxidase
MFIKNIVLGAGLTGLSASVSLKKDYLLVEKNKHVGGLTSTEKIKDYLFDHTGHWLHLKNLITKKFIEKIMFKKMLKINRQSKVLFDGRLGDFPFQYNLSAYKKDFITKCLVSLMKRKEYVSPKNFEEFCTINFGHEIANSFLLPYNLKLWGADAKNISHKWCERFFPKPNTENIIAGALGGSNFQGYNDKFYYPKKGGIGTLSNTIYNSLDKKKTLLNAKVSSINFVKKKITINNSIFTYKNLISTIPLPNLLGLLENVPANIKNQKNKLKCTKLRYINYGIKNKILKNIHWLYIPDKNIPFYRIGCSSNAVPSLAPKGCSSVYLEVSNNNNHSDKEILRLARKFLLNNNIIKTEKDIEVEALRKLDFGYVIFDKNYDSSRNAIHNFLNKNSIFSLGRYGSWIYSSMEDSMLEGFEIKKNINA